MSKRFSGCAVGKCLPPIFLILAGLLCWSSAFGGKWSPPTEAEIRTLPPYCGPRLNQTPDASRWKRIIPEFISIHHYCFGRTFLNRAMIAMDPRERAGWVSAAIGELSYMVKGDRPGAALISEYYLYRGIAYTMQRDDWRAAADFTSALRHDPKQVLAYARLAGIYKNAQDNAKALEVVSDGLRHVPASSLLQEEYLALGGKKPFPEPLKAAVPEEPPATSAPPVASEAPSRKAKGQVAETNASGTKASPEIAGLGEGPVEQPAAANDGRTCRFCAVDELDRPSTAQEGRTCRFCAEP